jgi:hypothetical protein
MITITGTVGSSGKYLVTGIPVDTTANAVLKIAPPWNGPWFRRQGFTTMPESEVGAGLLAVLTRHASFLDMQSRETLWFPIIKARSVVQNSWIPLKNSVPSPS